MKTIEVSAGILVKENTIFCAQRKDEGPLARKWEFPGGKLEPGEKPEEALKRELYEELNIDAKVGKHITTVEHQYAAFNLIMHCYFCEISSPEIKLNEHIDSRWLTTDELSLLDWADADIPVVEKVKEIMN